MVFKPSSKLLSALVLSLLFMQVPGILPAQSKSIITSWQVVARAAGNSSGYDIYIEQYRDKTNFIFKRLDSLRQRDMEKDLAYIEQRAAIKAATTVDEVTYQIEKLATVMELFEVSKKDSLSYRSVLPNQTLKSLLDSLANLPTETLQNNTAGIKTEKRVADGYSFHFIRFNGKKKTADFFTAAPTPDSHPLLFRLITETLGFYRKEKTNAILTPDFIKAY